MSDANVSPRTDVDLAQCKRAEEPFVLIRNVWKSFPPRPGNSQPHHVFQGFSLEIAKNEVLGILGPNGVGKTVTCGLLSNELTPDRGDILIDGSPPGRVRVGHVHQNAAASLFPWLRTVDNISLGLLFSGIPKAERRRRVEELLDEAGMSLDLDAYPQHHSGGNQHLVAFFRAMLIQPDLLLMDEPFHSLDLENRMLVQEKILHTWRETATTSLVISHEPADLVLLADRVVVLSPFPPHVAGEVTINLPRPRQLNTTMTHSNFGALEQKIRLLFQKVQRPC